MSLLPCLLEELSRPTIYDQHFGLGLLDDDIMSPRRNAYFEGVPAFLNPYRRPLRLFTGSQSGLSHIRNDKDNFKVNLDVQQFKPDEVSVKVANGYVVIDGKHEERNDEHGFISRQFTRRYKLPENVDPNTVTSSLSSDGVLSIGAPKKSADEKKDERSIPIVQTNQPSIKVSANKDKEVGEQMETN